YVTVMHDVAESPGFAFETLYIAVPESLSLRTTVPAENELPSFDVVLLNAENVPTPATAPTRPMIRSVSSSFCPLLISDPPFAGWSPGVVVSNLLDNFRWEGVGTLDPKGPNFPWAA